MTASLGSPAHTLQFTFTLANGALEGAISGGADLPQSSYGNSPDGPVRFLEVTKDGRVTFESQSHASYELHFNDKGLLVGTSTGRGGYGGGRPTAQHTMTPSKP